VPCVGFDPAVGVSILVTNSFDEWLRIGVPSAAPIAEHDREGASVKRLFVAVAAALALLALALAGTASFPWH
jgi:hypothetical protein